MCENGKLKYLEVFHQNANSNLRLEQEDILFMEVEGAGYCGGGGDYEKCQQLLIWLAK